MVRRPLNCLIAACLVVSAAPAGLAFAEDAAQTDAGIVVMSDATSGTVEGTAVTWSFDEDSGTLTIGGSGAVPDGFMADTEEKAAEFPALVQSNDSALSTVVFGDGITSVGANAFSGCYTMETIVFGAGLKEIGNNAFTSRVYPATSTTKVANVDFSKAVNLEVIGDQAFYMNCISSINGVSEGGTAAFPSSLKKIGQYAFSCQVGKTVYSLFAANVDSKLTVPGTCQYTAPLFGAFQRLTVEAAPPYGGDGWTLDESGLLTIESDTGMSGFDVSKYPGVAIKEIKIGEGVTTIPRKFSDLTDLVSVSLPEGLESIEGSAFSGCTSLAELVIPEGVKSIGISAFYNCAALASVSLPASVEKIGGGAFWGCSALSSFVIAPDSNLTEIGSQAFRDCSSLASLDLSTTKIEEFSARPLAGLKVEELKLPSSLTLLGTEALSGLTLLKYLEIPYGVTAIGDSAIMSCGSLTSLVIPGSVTSIGTSAFSGCEALESLVIPAALDSFPANEVKPNANGYGSVSLWGDVAVTACGISPKQEQAVAAAKEGGLKDIAAVASSLEFVQHGDEHAHTYVVEDGHISFTCSLCGKEAHYDVAVNDVAGADADALRQEVEARPGVLSFAKAVNVFVSETPDANGIAAYADGPVESVYLDKPMEVSVDLPDAEEGATYVAYAAGSTQAVPVTRSGDGYTFTAEEPGDYSIARAATHTLSFESNGGSDVADQVLAADEVTVKPADPTREGYVFQGWFADEDLTQPFEFGKAITEDTVVYAKWEPSAAIAGADDEVESGPGEDADASVSETDVEASLVESKTLPTTGDDGAQAAGALALGALGAAGVAVLARRRRNDDRPQAFIGC